MKIRDLQGIYHYELYIYHLTDQLFYGFITEIPEELLDKKIVELNVNYNGGMECAWIEVDV